MPLRDHFRSPLDDVRSWDELHGMWPAMIVRELNLVLPEPYYAAPGIHLGTLYEIDVERMRTRPRQETLTREAAELRLRPTLRPNRR
jgi:hypothetical protein